MQYEEWLNFNIFKDRNRREVEFQTDQQKRSLRIINAAQRVVPTEDDAGRILNGSLKESVFIP